MCLGLGLALTSTLFFFHSPLFLFLFSSSSLLYTTPIIPSLDPLTLNQQDQDSITTTHNNNNHQGSLCGKQWETPSQKTTKVRSSSQTSSLTHALTSQEHKGERPLTSLLHHSSFFYVFLLVGGQIASAGLWKIHRGTKRTTGQEVAVFVSLSCRLFLFFIFCYVEPFIAFNAIFAAFRQAQPTEG